MLYNICILDALEDIMRQRDSTIVLNAVSEFSIKHLRDADGQYRYILNIPIDAFDDSPLYDLGHEFIVAVNEYAKENSPEALLQNGSDVNDKPGDDNESGIESPEAEPITDELRADIEGGLKAALKASRKLDLKPLQYGPGDTMSKKNTEDTKVYIITKNDPELLDITAITLDEYAAKHYCDVHNTKPDYDDFMYEEHDLDGFDRDEEQRTLYTCAILLKTGEVIGEEEKIVIVNKNINPEEREVRIEAGPFSAARDYKPSDLAVIATSYISAIRAYAIACEYRDLVNGDSARGKAARNLIAERVGYEGI